MVPMTGGSSTAVKILGTALAGAMGDTTDQIISNGKVDVVRTIKSGLMSAATAAAGAVISKAVSSTAGRTLYNSKGDASPGKAQEQSKPKVKTYQTYTKTNIKTGEVYSGRTSGYGSPSQNVAARDINHHMNSKGFGPAVLDRSSTNAAAIRGREQILIDSFGGAKSMGGTSGNTINGIAMNNLKRLFYLTESIKEFGK